MKRHALQQFLPMLVLASIPCLGLAGCARHELPSVLDRTAATGAVKADHAAEKAAIQEALHRQFEAGRQDPGEEQAVEVSQLSLDSGYALVTWEHEKKGGQALLYSRAGAWTVLESKPGWLGFKGIRKEVPGDVAKRLLDEIDPNWPSYETY